LVCGVHALQPGKEIKKRKTDTSSTSTTSTAGWRWPAGGAGRNLRTTAPVLRGAGARGRDASRAGSGRAWRRESRHGDRYRSHNRRQERCKRELCQCSRGTRCTAVVGRTCRCRAAPDRQPSRRRKSSLFVGSCRCCRSRRGGNWCYRHRCTDMKGVCREMRENSATRGGSMPLGTGECACGNIWCNMVCNAQNGGTGEHRAILRASCTPTCLNYSEREREREGAPRVPRHTKPSTYQHHRSQNFLGIRCSNAGAI
jgi:hypothetical protein